MITVVLNRTFEDHWSGQCRHIKWPAHSPDLTPLDFYLWGKLKQEMYQKMLMTTEDMKDHIKTGMFGGKL